MMGSEQQLWLGISCWLVESPLFEGSICAIWYHVDYMIYNINIPYTHTHRPSKNNDYPNYIVWFYIWSSHKNSDGNLVIFQLAMIQGWRPIMFHDQFSMFFPSWTHHTLVGSISSLPFSEVDKPTCNPFLLVPPAFLLNYTLFFDQLRLATFPSDFPVESYDFNPFPMSS